MMPHMQWQELQSGDDSRPHNPAAFEWTEIPVSNALSPAEGYRRDCLLLGVDVKPTLDDLHAAYRVMVLRHHPDRVDEAKRADAEERLKHINLAYGNVQRVARAGASFAAKERA